MPWPNGAKLSQTRSNWVQYDYKSVASGAVVQEPRPDAIAEKEELENSVSSSFRALNFNYIALLKKLTHIKKVATITNSVMMPSWISRADLEKEG